LRANLPGAEGEIVQKAMEAAADQMPVNPETGLFDPYPQRLADGLVELAATTGDTSSPPQITIHADLEALTTQHVGVTELEHGGLIPNEIAQRLSCDCVVETVVTDGSVVVGVGRNSRTVPGWFRRPSGRWSVSAPRMSRNEVDSGSSHPTLGRRWSNRSRQSDPVVWISPSIPP
jgi:hypothetical protein